MKISINTDTSKVVLEADGYPPKEMPLHSREAFKAVSQIWIIQQWSQLNWQSFSWLGFQLCQLPEDALASSLFQVGRTAGNSGLSFAALR